MSPFDEPRLPYHVDGTRVFHQLRSNDSRFPEWFDVKDYHEFTEEQRAYLNGDTRHGVTFSGTGVNPELSFTTTLASKEVDFFFPCLMDLTGIFLGINSTYQYRDVRAYVSADTTSLDDGTWTEIGPLLLSEILPNNFGYPPTNTTNDAREAKLNEPTTAVTVAIRMDPASHRSAWDAPHRSLGYKGSFNSSDPATFRDGIGAVPLYGGDWAGVRALRITTPGTSFNSLGQNVVIHLYGRPTNPDDAGLTYERADGAPLQHEDLDWGNVPMQSGDHILGPFRLRNTTDKTAEGVVATVDGSLSWLTTEITSMPADIVSPILPYITARIGGGSWISSPVSGKKIEVPVGDLAPGEFSDDIEVRLNYPGSTLPGWSRSNVVLLSSAEAWT